MQTGILTPEKYIKGIKVYKKKTDELLTKATKELGASSETVARLKKRASILSEEIAEMDAGA